MEKEINPTQYQEGIFDICDFLVTELVKFLKDEGRYKYRMIDYIKTIQDEFDKAHKFQTKNDINIYGRVLYVFRKSITQEYKRLRLKKVSPGDCVICIILKLINLSESLEGENRFAVFQDNIKQVIQKFYSNILNKSKHDHLRKLENTFKESVENNKWGTLSLDELNLYYIEHPKEKKQEVIGEKKTWGSSNGKEVNF